MPPADKKSSKPEPKQDAKQNAPAPKKIEVTLPTLSLEMGPQFKMKLVMLGLLVVVFAFAMLLFTRANFATQDLFDAGRLQYNLPKLWGLWFIIFILAFSLSLALAMLHGYGSSKLQSLFPLVVLFLVAAVLGVMNPHYSLAFYGFALCLGAASIEAALAKDLSAHTLWSMAGRALMVLMIAAFLFSFMRFSGERDTYFNQMLSSASALAPELVQGAAPAVGDQVIGLCADAIDSVSLTRSQVENAISKDEVAASLQASGGAIYSAMPNSTKQQIVDAAYASAVDQATVMGNRLRVTLATSIRNINASAEVRAANVTQFLSPDTLRREVEKLPITSQLKEWFPLAAALSVVSIVTLLNFFVHIFATIFAWGLNKVI